MSSPDAIARIDEQSRKARQAISEAQDVIARCIAALESSIGTSDACGQNQARGPAPGSEMVPRATSRFQMNSTTNAPTVAVIKPAP